MQPQRAEIPFSTLFRSCASCAPDDARILFASLTLAQNPSQRAPLGKDRRFQIEIRSKFGTGPDQFRPMCLARFLAPLSELELPTTSTAAYIFVRLAQPRVVEPQLTTRADHFNSHLAPRSAWPAVQRYYTCRARRCNVKAARWVRDGSGLGGQDAGASDGRSSVSYLRVRCIEDMGRASARVEADRHDARILTQKSMKYPPFTGIFAPVMKPASSAARKSTVRAISRGSPRRPTGMLAMIWLRISSGTAWTRAVLQ